MIQYEFDSILFYSVNYLDKHLTAGMPSNRSEDWQPLLTYRNSLVQGEQDPALLPPSNGLRPGGKRAKKKPPPPPPPPADGELIVSMFVGPYCR